MLKGPISADAPSPLLTSRAGIVSTGLLIAMSVLYGLAVANQASNPAWAHVRAFAEAAMVGGLADWFAVTAIFRRPLGLPIPHTAVIPRSKDRIADALGEFVAVNFLAPQVVRERLERQDLAKGLAQQLADPTAARRIADGALDAAPSIIALLDDETVSEFLSRQLRELSADARLAGAIGAVLRFLTEQGRHQPVVNAALAEGWSALEQNQAAIRAQVRANTAWIWRLIALDARAADALIGALEQSLQDMSKDENHPARRRITEWLHKLADDLERSPQLRSKIEDAVADLLTYPAVGEYLRTLWRNLKDGLAIGGAKPEVREALADALARFGQALLDDSEVQASVNTRLRALLVDIAARHGRNLGALISETIRSWDTRTVVSKLEQNVGPDLQYIRINGTLIGGLIGLGIHQITVLLA